MTSARAVGVIRAEAGNHHDTRHAKDAIAIVALDARRLGHDECGERASAASFARRRETIMTPGAPRTRLRLWHWMPDASGMTSAASARRRRHSRGGGKPS